MAVHPVLSVEDLRVDIHLKDSVVHAVDGVSIRLDANEMVALVGESGSGKTMTALSIMRMLPVGGRISSGSIRLGGRELTTLTEDEMRRSRGNEIGMIFQDPFTSLNPTMPIGKQISQVVRRHRETSGAEAAERAVEVLDLVGLPHARQRYHDYPHQCSGGMRQRVMIAMALSCEPRVLIADEPTTALDVSVQHQILELIDNLRERLGMAVLLVSHDLGMVAGRVDRVAVMYAGKVAETADTHTLFTKPRHPYTEALFEALPERAVETESRLYSIPGMPPDLSEPPPGCRFAPRCRHAAPRCSDEEPPQQHDASGHQYMCFYPLQKPAAVRVDDRTPQGDGTDDARDETPVLLSVRRLVKDFPLARGVVLQRRKGSVSAVADVSFDVHRGETVGLVGESGCGKTTIGRLIVGLETPTSGSIFFEDTDLTQLTNGDYGRTRRLVQLMFQDSSTSMNPRMRVGPTLREPLAVQRMGNRAEQQRRVRELLDRVGLPANMLSRYPHEFSGGQRQRLALARALTLRPRLLIADEPVSAMDMSVQAQILNLVRDLQRDLGLTCLFISHDLSVIRYLANRIGVMHLGKLVEIGPAEDVYRHPAHPYTNGLIESAPVIDPRRGLRRAQVGLEGDVPSPIDPPSGCRFRTRCPRAQEICARVEPDLRAFSGDGHVAACHFPLQRPLDT